MYVVKSVKYITIYTYFCAIKWYFANILEKKCKKIHIGRMEKDLLPLVEVSEYLKLVDLT